MAGVFEGLLGSIAALVLVTLFFVRSKFFRSPPKPVSSIISIPSAYDEDTIVSLIEEIYNILIRLSYIPSNFMQYVPPKGHKLNESLCFSLNLQPRVIALLKRLPQPVQLEPSQEFELIPGSKACHLMSDDVIRLGRAVQEVSDEKKVATSHVGQYDVVLTMFNGNADLVLDTQDNTIRTVSEGHNTTSSGEAKLRYFVQREDAPTVLRQFISDYKNLVWIPCNRDGLHHIVTSKDQEYLKVKKILAEGYDWPHGFRQEDWGRHHNRIWRESTRT